MIGKGCLKEYRKERVNREAATAGPERAMGTLAEETLVWTINGKWGAGTLRRRDPRCLLDFVRGLGESFRHKGS